MCNVFGNGFQEDLLHHLPWHRCEADQPVVPQTLLLLALEDRNYNWFTPTMGSMHTTKVSMPVSTLCSPLSLLKEILGPETSPDDTKYPDLVVMLLKILVQCLLHCPHITLETPNEEKSSKKNNLLEPESVTKFQGWKKPCALLWMLLTV